MSRRRFGIDLYLGVGEPGDDLPRQYRDALAQAHGSLTGGGRPHLTQAHVGVGTWAEARRALGLPVGVHPEVVVERFDRYLDEVPARVGHRLELARHDLEAGFERAAESLVGVGGLGAAPLRSLVDDVAGRAAGAPTVRELVALYRAAFAELVAVLSHRTDAQRDRSLRRAEDFVAQHAAERISLRRAAREAGFAPAYFSRLFRKKHGVTFQHYVIRTRVERARQLLASTSLDLARIAELAGFCTAQHFVAVFRRYTGVTPGRFRTRDVRMFGPRSSESDVRRHREGAIRET
jgi:AraC-like DNA-binding protein